MRVLVEQRHREIDRARDRGARRPADRRLQDLVGDGIGGFRAVDHPPGNDDLLVARCGPFEIGHRNLAVRAGLQRLQKFLGDDGLRVALALERQFVHIHRIGNIDREHQFDIDGRVVLLAGQLMAELVAGVRRRDTRDVTSGHGACDKHRPDRDTPAHQRPSRRLTTMVTRKLRREKREHGLSLHIQVSRTLPYSDADRIGLRTIPPPPCPRFERIRRRRDRCSARDAAISARPANPAWTWLHLHQFPQPTAGHRRPA